MGKKGLIGIVAAFMVLTGSLLLNYLRGKGGSEDSGPALEISTNFRKAVKPVGTLNVSITRLDSSRGRLADMNDRGDLLFITSESGAKKKSYVHEFGGKVVENKSIESDRGLNLGPDGILISTKTESMVDLNPIPLFPFYQNLSPTKTCQNSSILTVRRIHDQKSRTDLYGLEMDTQTERSAQVIGSTGPPMELNTKPSPALDPRASGEAGGGGWRGGSDANISTSSKVIYSSTAALTVLERSDTGAIWISEQKTAKGKSVESLVRLNGNVKDIINLPEGYHSVRGLVNTGSFVAATFGEVFSSDTIRSYIRTNEQWKELPIPDGYEFSFVQKVFNDGTILGYVTPSHSGAANPVADKNSVRQVVWKGDSCIILNDLPGWPKQGIVTEIILANRKGDIYVRNILNPQTGASEYYLLNVKDNP